MYTEAIKATVATVARLAGAHAETTGVAESRPRPVRAAVCVLQSVGRAPVFVRLSSASSKVSVYDASGRRIRILSEPQSLLPSPYSLTWDGRDFSGDAASPGVYYFRTAEASARFVLAE
jgi:hypothetical protein